MHGGLARLRMLSDAQLRHQGVVPESVTAATLAQEEARQEAEEAAVRDIIAAAGE